MIGMHDSPRVVLAGKGLTKRYPGVVSLNNVDFDVRVGEVHGLIGENGAGKSTLMRILSGVIQPDEGVIHLDEKPIEFTSPRQATDHGIAIVHQELNLIPYLSVAENIFLGRELANNFGWIQSQEQLKQSGDLLAGLDPSINPRVEVNRLRVGQQQVVEIAKALNCNARVIFMDEPTSAISDQEVAALFQLIRDLRKSGVSIVYVSHKLDELLQISDRITILRDGRLVDTVQTANTDRQTIVRLMVGRQLEDLYIHSPVVSEPRERLRVESLSLLHINAQRPVVDDFSFHACSGEVVGIFGLMGAGRTELLESIFGLHPRRTTGTILIDGQQVTIGSPEDAFHLGIGLVPEDRKHQGLVLGMSVQHNMSLSHLAKVESFGLLSSKRERAMAESYIEQLSIRTPGVAQTVRNLSGGNQQKVVLAKVLSRDPKILLLDEPTRGIDVGGKREIYRLIDQLKKEGIAIVVVSSELPELLGIADRIVVMCEGKKTGQFDRSTATEELLMHAAVPTTSPLPAVV